jgi:hypothetical protein
MSEFSSEVVESVDAVEPVEVVESVEVVAAAVNAEVTDASCDEVVVEEVNTTPDVVSEEGVAPKAKKSGDENLFAEMNLSDSMKAALAGAGYVTATPIQAPHDSAAARRPRRARSGSNGHGQDGRVCDFH